MENHIPVVRKLCLTPDVWLCGLDRPAEDVDALHGLLSPDERRRAARYRFDSHRRRFIVGRGMLRTILGQYAASEPRELCFQYGSAGKPMLKRKSGHAPIYFNMSHSHELAMIAISRSHDVGVDLERIRPLSYQGIVRRFFSESERVGIESLPPEARLSAFFRVWTCKEACLKAWSHGLSSPLSQVGISMPLDESPRMAQTGGDCSETRRWTLYEMNPLPGWVAAVAVEAE